MTIRETIATISQCAKEVYGEREAAHIGRIMVMELGGYSSTQIIINGDQECTIENLDNILEQIRTSRPIQYIIGETEFCSLPFKVAEGVLIPRPETEELVMWIVESNTIDSPQILDIGTGSGAIAISLSKLLPKSSVRGVDISPEALRQAQINNKLNEADVLFSLSDALRGVEHTLPDFRADIIVSNPPYIPRSESGDMRSNVTDFEPHLALFVTDEDPLIFYRSIAQSGVKILNRRGLLFFEIHENFGEEMVDMLSEMGYTNITLRNDINQKPRMICAQRL